VLVTLNSQQVEYYLMRKMITSLCLLYIKKGVTRKSKLFHSFHTLIQFSLFTNEEYKKFMGWQIK